MQLDHGLSLVQLRRTMDLRRSAVELPRSAGSASTPIQDAPANGGPEYIAKLDGGIRKGHAGPGYKEWEL